MKKFHFLHIGLHVHLDGAPDLRVLVIVLGDVDSSLHKVAGLPDSPFVGVLDALLCCLTFGTSAASEKKVINMTTSDAHNLACGIAFDPEAWLCGDFFPPELLEVFPDSGPPESWSVDKAVNALEQSHNLMVFKTECST